MLNCRLARLSLDKVIIFSFFLGPGKTVAQVPSILVYISAQICPSGRTADLQRHVLIQSAADKLFLGLSSLDTPATAPLLPEGDAERPNKGRGKEAWLNCADDV